VRVSAKVDYALRAAVELAAADPDVLVKAETIADAQDIPRAFLGGILQSLRAGGIVESRRGRDGGHRLQRPAAEISLAEVIRAVDGPLANVGGRSPDELDPPGPAAPLREVWVAVRAALRDVLEQTTLADVAGGRVPDRVLELTQAPGAWARR
jgi:Rrf2 family protein